MTEKKSVLWKDASIDRDEVVVRGLVSKIVIGSERHEQCIKDALSTIHTNEWQKKFPNTTFVHSIQFSHINHSLALEVSFTLKAQALELIYYCISDYIDAYDRNASFDKRLKLVFFHIYGWKMPDSTAHAIRILRNNVMHTGSLGGIYEDKELERHFKSKYLKPDDGQKPKRVTQYGGLTRSFEYLMDDMLMRIFGLRQEEHLSRNGMPAWRYRCFGYTHGETNTSKL
jgi:hypothetical protein